MGIAFFKPNHRVASELKKSSTIKGLYSGADLRISRGGGGGLFLKEF